MTDHETSRQRELPADGDSLYLGGVADRFSSTTINETWTITGYRRLRIAAIAEKFATGEFSARPLDRRDASAPAYPAWSNRLISDGENGLSRVRIVATVAVVPGAIGKASARP
jgi:hypothetical protein